MRAYFAAQLASPFAVIVVEVIPWGTAELAAALFRYREAFTRLDRL